MVEHVQSVTPLGEAATSDAVQDLAPFEPSSSRQADQLRQAVADAQMAIPVDQAAAAGALNALLEQLPPSDPNGRVLLELIESSALNALVDHQGKRCRVEAVRALLRLGFPWALEIHPETLAWFRKAEASRASRSRSVLLAVVLFAVSLGAVAGYFQPELRHLFLPDADPPALEYPGP